MVKSKNRHKPNIISMMYNGKHSKEIYKSEAVEFVDKIVSKQRKKM